MPETHESLGKGRTSLPTLGCYITTKFIVGSEPMILEAKNRDSWNLGRSKTLCDIVIPNPFISTVNGQICYRNTKWTYTHLGANPAYFSQDDTYAVAKLEAGDSVTLTHGTNISFLTKQPNYAIEFFPGMGKECKLEDPTESGAHGPLSELQYIDTMFELLAYAIHVLTSITFARFLVVVIALTLVLIFWLN